ncbi:MAG: hypothetical protein KA165_06395, partial [Saprospiraceae bacterium]|nr:hypothetical protein [Saprospiraceae bacterium]
SSPPPAKKTEVSSTGSRMCSEERSLNLFFDRQGQNLRNENIFAAAFQKATVGHVAELVDAPL